MSSRRNLNHEFEHAHSGLISPNIFRKLTFGRKCKGPSKQVPFTFALKRPVLSLTSSNEDEPTRSLEQRVTTLKSNNAQLEKELVEMGERLDELEDRRINYLTQEVFF